VRWAAIALVALALSGCESTQEKAAKLERAARNRDAQVAQRASLAQRALSIGRPSSKVRVTATAVLRGSEGSAVVLTLHNLSATPLRGIPIAITVRDARGAFLYTNEHPGQGSSLLSAPLLPAHGELTWIDDQIQAGGIPASVGARIGEAPPARSPIPQLSVAGAHQFEDPTSGPGAEGTIVNHSAVGQQELVVYAVARRGGRIVAAGRAVLPQAPAGASTRFQLYFVGDPRGAQLQLSAPPTTLG
jgi:hypothetical protein